METVIKGIDSDFLKRIISERCTEEEFLEKMKMSQKRFRRLINCQAEATQDEMLRTAAILHLSNAEFVRCFFSR